MCKTIIKKTATCFIRKKENVLLNKHHHLQQEIKILVILVLGPFTVSKHSSLELYVSVLPSEKIGLHILLIRGFSGDSTDIANAYLVKLEPQGGKQGLVEVALLLWM